MRDSEALAKQSNHIFLHRLLHTNYDLPDEQGLTTGHIIRRLWSITYVSDR